MIKASALKPAAHPTVQAVAQKPDCSDPPERILPEAVPSVLKADSSDKKISEPTGIISAWSAATVSTASPSDNSASAKPAGNLSPLIHSKQNMLIEFSGDNEEVPQAIIDLSLRMLGCDPFIREIINHFRVLYSSGKEDFYISLEGKTEKEKKQIVRLFRDMYGIISFLHFNEEANLLKGRLVLSPKAQNFINGRYLEIAVFERTRRAIHNLSEMYNKPYEVYHNVRVVSREGLIRNEFDLVIVFDKVFYVIEIKSGKQFRQFDKYMRIGHEYNIVPGRFLLVDNYLTEAHADTIEYFCDYYVSNLEGNSLEKKLRTMIENDLQLPEENNNCSII